MPAGDRSGPMGMGPMTGRAAGYCAGYSVPGYMNPVSGYGYGGGFGWGRGFGRGRGGWGGRGRGNRWGFWATGLPGWARGGWYPQSMPWPGPFAAPGAQPRWNPEDERQFLEEQMQMLQEKIEGIRQRIDELSAESAEAEE